MIIGTEHYIALSAVLFALGGAGFLFRRNVLVALMSIEVMLNAVNLALVAFNRARADTGAHSGQLFAFFIIAAEAAEVAVGLAIVLSMFRLHRSVRSDEADSLKN